MDGDVEMVGTEAMSAVAPQELMCLSNLEPVKAYVDFACVSGEGDVALIGWLYDPQDQVQGFDVVGDPQQGSAAQQGSSVGSSPDDIPRVGLKRVARPDVAQAMDKDASAMFINYGFVLVVPGMCADARLALMLVDGRCVELPFTALGDRAEIRSTLPQYWSHSGPTLLVMLRRMLGEENALTRLVEGLDDQGVAVGARYSFAACDHALMLPSHVLMINGWISKPTAELERIEVVVAGKITDITERIVRYVRPDLYSAHPWSEAQSLGFLCAFTLDMGTTNALTINVVCHSGMRQVLECDLQYITWDGLGSLLHSHSDMAWPLLGLLEKAPDGDEGFGRSTGRLAVLRRDCFLAHVPYLPMAVDQPATAIATVEWAYPLGAAGLLLCGVMLTPGPQPRAVLLRGPEGECFDISSRCTPVFRPDAYEKYRSRFPELDDWCGFVCVAPMPTRPGDVRALCLDFDDSGEVWLKVPVASEALEGPRLVRQLLEFLPPPRCRDALEAIGTALDQTPLFDTCIEEYEDELIGQDPYASILACDQSHVLNGRVLLVYGWIGLDQRNLSRVELVTSRGDFDVTSRVRRTMRPDMAAQFSWAAENPAGFLLLIEDGDLVGQSLRMRVRGTDGRRQLCRLSPAAIDWRDIANLVGENPLLERPLVELLSGTSTLEPDDVRLQGRIESLRRCGFRARYPQLPVYVENPVTMIGAVDSAYVLGDGGILIFGWSLTPVRKPQRVTLRSDDGQVLDVTANFTRLVRPDVLQSFQSQFPAINEWLGYVCFAALPTSPGEGRALSFDFGEQGEVWFKVPTESHHAAAVGLIKSVLGAIPAPDRMRHTLYTLFSGGLGAALESVNRSRPPFGGSVEERQFGVPLAEPANSIIVPLYGRCDFLRHQLAQFADDPDFGHTELLYVVDDPALLSETLELAARYAPLFRVPFRVLWYGENRGFAGANNIGAHAARGENLLLVNSDVIPQRSGWISTLAAALHELPDAGAVGPLLLFGDESVQHAGMYPRADDLYPGFLLNTHKGMGTVWEGGDAPSEHPMLTAACLMLKKCDFEAVGGFDEGYVIGDFEDSDLCLALRKRGKRMWLVPEAPLWHLERQSQNLGQAIGERQMVTLFNGWRYAEKIRAGDICDPLTVELRE